MPSRRDHRRIALLLPSNTTQKPELTRIVPDGVTLHRRAPGTAHRRAILHRADCRAHRNREPKLADADVDAIVLAATAPSSCIGIGYGQELIKRIETASGKKATTASTALIQALTVLDTKRLVTGVP